MDLPLNRRSDSSHLNSVIQPRRPVCQHSSRAAGKLSIVLVACLLYLGAAALPRPLRASIAATQAPDAASPGARQPSSQTQAPHAGSTQLATTPEELVVGGESAGQRVAARPGEICVVCNHPISGQDIVYLVNGQRVPVHEQVCLGALLARPGRFLAGLQPRGAFLGAGSEGQVLSDGWFLFGLYVLLGLVFGALCAHRALHRGRSSATWFVLGLLVNVFAFITLMTLPPVPILAPAGVPGGLRKVPITYAPAACSSCGARNHPAAARCTGCGAKLQPAIHSEVEKVGLRSS